MKILQTVVTTAPETSEASALSYFSQEMPDTIREETLKFGRANPAEPSPALAAKTFTAEGSDWLLLKRTVQTGEAAPISHTLAIPGEDHSWVEPHLRSLLDQLKHDFARKARDKSDETGKQFESVLAEFRREVTDLRNRVEEYTNAKWWHFDREDEIRRRSQELKKLELSAKSAARDELDEYDSKASMVIRLLTAAEIPAKDPSLAEPHCFPDLQAKFEKLAQEYRELTRILTICDRTNIAEASATELSASKTELTEDLSVTKRELEVSKLSDKIMSSSMKMSRKEKARANSGKFSTISRLVTTVIALSLTVAILLTLLLTKG